MNIPTNETLPNLFPFTIINDGSVTSAGSYLNGVLIRTLWGNAMYNSGTHSQQWDGKDDDGNPMPIGAYQIKVSSNKNSYDWLGTLGNNSFNPSGPDIWRGGTGIIDMVQIGSKMNCVMAFSERSTCECKFDTSSPGQKLDYQAYGTTFAGGLFICANATYKFIASKDYQGVHNFVHGELVSDDSNAMFTAGVLFTGVPPQINYASVLDLNALGNPGVISGMAVQQRGNGYLYVSHKNQNIINVYKTGDGSGSFVTAISLAGPTNLEFETDGFLWVAQANTVTKYIVNTDGTITPTASIISRLARPAGLSVLNGDLAIFDAGDQQIIKRYDSATLAPTSVTGQPGGYQNTAVVSNDRFYIEDLRGEYLTNVRHDNTGGFWAMDTGNARCQHFDINGNFIESIAYIPLYLPLNTGVNLTTTYNANICQNQNTAIFSGWLEYNIDYSAQFNTSWALVNNWGYNLPVNSASTGQIVSIALLSNNRRYLIFTDHSTGFTYEAELSATGLRIITSPLIPQFCTYNTNGDGSLTNFSSTSISLQYKIYPLLSFDVSGNPVRGSASVLPSIVIDSQDPLPQQRTLNVTADGKTIVFDDTVTGSRNGGAPLYHLAAYDSNNQARKWRTNKVTFTAYRGILPTDGSYDIGNGVVYPAGSVAIVGNEIIWGYHGEFWKQVQTGLFYHYNSIGLMQAMVGHVGKQIGSQAAAGYPGYYTNTLSTNATDVNGNIYLFFNDESINCGISVWKITLNNVNVENIPFMLTDRILNQPDNKIDLLQSYPSGWMFNPALYFNAQNDQFFITHGTLNLDKTSIQITASVLQNITTTYTAQRILPVSTGLNYWLIGGVLDLSLLSFASRKAGGGNFFISVTDNNGKILAKLEAYNDQTISFNGVNHGPYINPNSGSAQYGNSQFVIQKFGAEVKLCIFLFGQWLIDTQPIFDNSGDVNSPAGIAWNFHFQNVSFGVKFGIIELNIQAG